MPTALANKRVLVQGLGRFGGGVGVTRFLVEQGAIVTVTDTAPEAELQESVGKLADLPQGRVFFKLGGHDLADFTSADLLVTNPAVDKAKSEHVAAARAGGVPITTEMNLFLERNSAFTVGITGSVGKSTTTMLVYLAVKAAVDAGTNVFLGGNIGKSLLSELPAIRANDIVILEISSFMLEDTPAIGWSPNIAVVTNLFPNHLDRHNTMAEYAAAKQNILKFQKPGDVAIFNADHDLVSRWTHFAKGTPAKYTTRGPKDKWVKLLIPGVHNQSNAQAALAVLDHLSKRYTINRAAAEKAMGHFKGLSHRLELVHAADLAGRRVGFYNDSKATSPDASITAIGAFDPGTAIFFAGGYDKHIDLSAYEDALAQRAGGVIGIGQTGQQIVDAVKSRQPRAAARAAFAETLDRGIPLALEWARQDPAISAVVLSPASASWGQFKNYEERGARFAALASSLANQ